MDDRQIEAALRAGHPDEPQYRGDTGEVLRSRATSSSEPDRLGHAVDVVTPPPRRQPKWPAFAGAAAAAILLLVGLATIARRDAPDSASIPTTTSDAPTSTTAPGTLPPELIDRWVGATPSAVSTPNPSAPAFLVLTGDQVSLEYLAGGIVNGFTSDVAVAAPGEVVLTLNSQIGRCAAGATGDYRWSVSPRATTLTIEAIDDECPERVASFAGTWTHTACPTRGNDCLGLLEAGTYASVNFDPFDTDSYGQVTYSVPDGWTSTLDDKARLTLVPPGADERSVHGLYLFADVAAATIDCPATSAASIGTDAIADAITSIPGLVATEARAKVGGFEARTIDIIATEPICDGKAAVLASKRGAVTPWSATIGEGQRMRVVLVDLTENRTLALVVVSDRAPSAYATLLEDAASVIRSLVLSDRP